MVDENDTLSQEGFDKLITRYFIHSMIPLQHIDKPYFKNLFSVFNIDKLRLKIMDRTTLEVYIEDAYKFQIQYIKDKLKNINNVSIFSKHVHQYLIVTCSWIGSDLSRKSLMLPCRDFYGSTDDLILHKDPKLERIAGINDYTHIVEGETQTIKDTNELYVRNGILVKEANYPTYVQHCFDEVIIPLLGPPVLYSKPPEYNSVEHYVSIVNSKWMPIWAASDKPTSNQIIHNIVGHSLPRIKRTAYNSQFLNYYTFQQILPVREKYMELTNALEITYLLEDKDFIFITEYLKIYKPFLEATDILGADKNLFYGVTLPCLLSLRQKLVRQGNKDYEYLQPAKYLEQFDKDFADFIDFSTKSAINAAIAAISYPKFKFCWLTCVDEQYREKLINAFSEAVVEAIAQIREQKEKVVESSLNVDFFEFEEGFDEQKFKAETLIIRYLADKDRSLSMLHRHEEIKAVFIKYNSPLSIKTFEDRMFLQNTIYQLLSIAESEDLLKKLVLLKCSE